MWSVMREIEVSLLRINQVTIEEGQNAVLNLAATKTDPAGRGRGRSHSCTCGQGDVQSNLCPVCLLARHLKDNGGPIAICSQGLRRGRAAGRVGSSWTKVAPGDAPDKAPEDKEAKQGGAAILPVQLEDMCGEEKQGTSRAPVQDQYPRVTEFCEGLVRAHEASRLS